MEHYCSLTSRFALSGTRYNIVIGVDGKGASVELLAASAVCILCGIFATRVWQDWQLRHRSYHLSWAIALTMACIAAAAYVGFLIFGRPIFLFRIYYLFGAALNVTYLGLGSLFLYFRRSLHPLVFALILLSLMTTIAVMTAPYDQYALLRATGAGTHVFPLGPMIWLLIINNTFGTICLVGVAIISGVRAFRRADFRPQARANFTIAVGALIVAFAGTSARLFAASSFWFTMLVGWRVLFCGFLLAGRSAVPRPTSAVLSTKPQVPQS